MTGKIVCPRCNTEVNTVYIMSEDLAWDDSQQAYGYIDGGIGYRCCGKCASFSIIDIDSEEIVELDKNFNYQDKIDYPTEDGCDEYRAKDLGQASPLG